MSTMKRPAALVTALLLGTLSLTACVQEAGEDGATPAAGGTVNEVETRVQPARFAYPPVQYQHRAE